jgi:hypothetical protein
MLTMRSALRDCATWKQGAFTDTLDSAQSPFWVAAREALVALQAELKLESRRARR